MILTSFDPHWAVTCKFSHKLTFVPNEANGENMKKILLIGVFFALAGTSLGQNLRIVNAASLSSVSVSPGSIITIFGKQLTTGIAAASNVETPPTTLGGVTVTIGGSAAALFYVSPTQINAVVNNATPVGTENVVVTSAAGTQTGTVTIDTNAPPGLFSLFGSGTRDGAILNAMTFLLGDFSARTANSPTYLALFATGLNTASAPTVTIGGVPVTVTFFGAAPCCAGLQQINVMLPDSLAGAGRVPIVVTSAGHSSNTVQVVLLPPSNARQFSDDEDNRTRSRELASLAYVPGTSLILSTDENDDVVRVIDVSKRQVTRVITLPTGANPDGIAVNAAGTLAVVAETGRGKVGIINLTTFAIVAEIATGSGPVNVGIADTQAVVVNQDADSVSIIDLATNTLQKTIAVGRGPEGVAVDAAAHLAYVTNEDDGTISVIDLAGLALTRTITLGTSVRPESLALVPGAGVAFITVPAAGPQGQVLLVNLTTGAVVSTLSANPDRTGGSSDIVLFGGKIYFANQAGGSVSVLPVNASGAAAGSITSLRVDLGARALAIDTKDNLLVVSNEGSGTLVLVSLASNSVIGRINAVKKANDDDDHDDHGDRANAANAPSIGMLSPVSARVGASLTLAITGTNLIGATEIEFIDPATLSGNGKGHGRGVEDHHADTTIVASNIQVASGGTQLTATITIAAGAKPGPRLVKVQTPNGETSGTISLVNTFTVLP
jgi:uncharacterized protein (TIGR03437 family)